MWEGDSILSWTWYCNAIEDYSLRTEKEHDMLRKCLLPSIHNQCDIVCTIHLILITDLLSYWFYLMWHLWAVEKEFAVFFKNEDISLDKKSLFFKCTDILLQNWASYFLHSSSIVVLYILLKQTNLSCNITGMLLTFMLFTMTVLFNLTVKTVNQLTLWPKLLSHHYCCIW